jgi:hypothetical protein
VAESEGYQVNNDLMSHAATTPVFALLAASAKGRSGGRSLFYSEKSALPGAENV